MAAENNKVKDCGDHWINAAGRKIPKHIEGYGETVPFAGAFSMSRPKASSKPRTLFRERRVAAEGGAATTTTGTGNNPVGYAVPGYNKMRKSIREVIEEFGYHDGMTVSFHHHLRAGDGLLVPVMKEFQKLGVRNIELAPSSLHEGQKAIVELFKDGTIRTVHTGANNTLGLSVSAGDLQGMMIVRSHGGRVRAITEGDINIDIAFIAAPECDNQGNCNGMHGKSACGPLGYSAIDAKLAKHVVVVTDNLVEYPCTPISISENYVDRVVVVPSIGDNKKIVSGTTRLSTDPQNLLIGESCARLMDALGLITPDFVFQAGSGGTSLTSMTALADKLRAKGISAQMANGGTTCILVDMLKEGLVRKLTTCQAFDLAAVKSMVEDWPKHVETDIDQYANPLNSGCVCNALDVMVAGATEVDVDFNCNVNTHSDGTFQHNTGGHQDTAAGAKLTIVTMPVARRCNPGVVDRVTSITTPGECIGAIVTEEGIAINPRRKDLLAKLEGKTEEELGFKLVTIEHLRKRGIEKAGRPHSCPRTQDRIVGVIEWRDGTVLDVVRQPLDRRGMGINSARVEVVPGKKGQPNKVSVTCIEDCPYVPPAQVEKMAHDIMAALGVPKDAGVTLNVAYDYAKAFIVATSIEIALKRKQESIGVTISPEKAYLMADKPRPYPAPRRDNPLRRSHLYIPGADAYMVTKGEGTAADGVILDLEDAVDVSQKDFARVVVRHALRHAVDFGKTEKMIRINGVNEMGFLDIQTVLPYAPVDVIVVPKVETAAEIAALEREICRVLGVDKSPVLLICLIESALGVENAYEIVNASPNIIGMSMGLEDYTADRGVERTESDEESQWALQRVANAVTTAGDRVQLIDVVYSTLDDVVGLERAITRAKKMGMFGKRCIHPNQAIVCNRCFNPEKPDIDESCAALTAFSKADPTVGVVKIIGKKGKAKMVDKPVLIRAIRCAKLAVAASLLPEDPWLQTIDVVSKRLQL